MLTPPCGHRPPRVRTALVGGSPHVRRFDASAGDCPFCHAGATVPAANRCYGGDGTTLPLSPAEPRPDAPLPCVHEGPVVDPCPSPDPATCERNSVRACTLNGASWSRCTRGPNPGADPDIRACPSCPHRRTA